MDVHLYLNPEEITVDIETAKTLKPGMRVRVTAVPTETHTAFGITLDGWFFKVGDEAELLQLDTTDGECDWWARFDDGTNWFLELGFGVDYEVLDGEA
jgi:hypothetical protein